ncbi:MAG: tRNA uridine-5-carboxymethylaminomethyl(34) synthesis GTPase MnmE, partial [Chitinophagaceae bacterium]
MIGKFSGWDDTIVALATPPGIGAIGVIRLSGTKALALIDSLFTAKKLSEQPTHTVHVGLLSYKGSELDEVVVTLYKAPRSYTGEDVVEISAHGSPHVQQRILDALLDSGARLAKPGEFTQRAFLNGKMDLIQAEAVADLIASGTDAARQAALHTLKGGFSEELKQLREQLVQFSALIELELDFSEEDVEFADRSQLKNLLEQAARVTNRLIDSFRLGNVIRQGVSVAIVGKPNAGKSTLLNVLLNENRALVSEIPGTTRDTIEEVLNIDGILFRLIDTAGLREHTSDQIESMGMEKSREKMKAADLVLLLFDVQQETAASLKQQLQQLELGEKRVVLVGNKAEGQEPAYWRAQYNA